MAEVITLVTGDIPSHRVEALEEAYRELVRGGLGPALEDTFLVKAGGDRVGILSLWHRRADLDALLASGEEPPARRLIRTHGGEPEVTIWEVVVRGRLSLDLTTDRRPTQGWNADSPVVVGRSRSSKG